MAQETNREITKVLLIEDNPGDARLIREVLAEDEDQDMAFKLEMSDRLSSGLERLVNEDIRVVLLDLSLPDSHGIDTFVKVHARVPGVPIVILSGDIDRTLALQAVQRGAQDYLIKGQVSREVLVRAIRYAMERKRAEERLIHLANHDALTGLPNRTLLFDRLSQSLTRTPWHKRLVAVLFLDLDHFKRINDTLGHDGGDQLLQSVAERLKGCVRPGDTVARLGGDEFAAVLTDIGRADDIPRMAQKILGAFSQPFMLQGREFFITTSIGISVSPNDADDPETLMKNADMAMYRAKEQGRNTHQHYSPAMNTRALERMEMEAGLRHALERDEFLLHYQPLVDLQTGQINAMEALLRWQHPKLGLVAPAKFIPLAEETGLILPIGEWVLRTACAQNRAWHDAGLPRVSVSVNLSSRQFHEKNLTQTVVRVLEETGLRPAYLALELTESIMENAKAAVLTLSELHMMGIMIAIDDFGTGYSSLSYLKRFPISSLKIDRSFVQDIASERDDAAIVSAIITLAHTLNLKAIAEGVETEQQLELLRSLHCDEMQGYLFSRPLPADQATTLLVEGKHMEVRPPPTRGN